MKEEFIKFLKKVKAYDKFITALRAEDKEFDSFINSSTPMSYIISAFTWYNTPDTSSFWSPLDDRWGKIVKNGKKNN